MISHGDEIGRTQRGNNNAYAQDNEISWVDWQLEPWQRELLAFTRQVFAVRHANPVLRRRSFFRGRPIDAAGAKDLTWLRPDGTEMTDGDWHDAGNSVLCMLISGEAADETDDRGRPVRGDTMLLLINGGFDPVTYVLPTVAGEGKWRLVVDTAGGTHGRWEKEQVALPGFSLSLLRYGVERRATWMGGEYASHTIEDIIAPAPEDVSAERSVDEPGAPVAEVASASAPDVRVGDAANAAADTASAAPAAEPMPSAPTRTAV
jgi:glycogen operon protein